LRRYAKQDAAEDVEQMCKMIEHHMDMNLGEQGKQNLLDMAKIVVHRVKGL